MTPEEIKTLIEQEAEKYMQTSPMCGDDKYTYIAGATFYEQTVLPKIVKGWKDNVEAWETAAAGAGINHVVEYHQKRIRELEDELSQLQSSMEERERIIWEAARLSDFSMKKMAYENYDDYISKSTPSTEGK